MKNISNFDYLGNAKRLSYIMKALESVDLDAIVATTEYAHALGPIVDPTLYKEQLGRGDMDSLRELAEALQPAVKIWNEKIVPKIPTEE